MSGQVPTGSNGGSDIVSAGMTSLLGPQPRTRTCGRRLSDHTNVMKFSQSDSKWKFARVQSDLDADFYKMGRRRRRRNDGEELHCD